MEKMNEEMLLCISKKKKNGQAKTEECSSQQFFINYGLMKHGIYRRKCIKIYGSCERPKAS